MNINVPSKHSRAPAVQSDLAAPKLKTSFWLRATAAAALIAAAATPVLAQSSDSKYWAHVGPVSVRFSSSADLTVGGAAVPGASAELSNNTALGFELGYDITPSVSLAFTVGTPPTTTLRGKGGPVDGIELGKVQYGPAVLTAQYRFDLGGFKPYLGVGVNRTLVLKSRDGAVANLDVKSAWGSVLQAGFDVPVSKEWSVFLDVKKIFLKTKGDGTLPAFGGAPATADITANPLLVMAGVGWRF